MFLGDYSRPTDILAYCNAHNITFISPPSISAVRYLLKAFSCYLVCFMALPRGGLYTELFTAKHQRYIYLALFTN